MDTGKNVNRISDEQKGDVLILKMEGRLDAITSEVAGKKIKDAIRSGVLKIIVDFSDIIYISSSGIRMLLEATKELGQASGKIVLYKIAPVVMNILEMTGCKRKISIVNSEEDAERAVGASK